MSARRRLLSVLGVLGALSVAVPAAAGAAGTGFEVTIAARSCPSYEAISANLARNNIQESLRDLGPDTAYASGEPIDPDKERANQPTCSPLPNWQFTLGTGYRSRAVSGPWGSLSIVTGAFPTPITTKATSPLLNTTGQPTGRSLAGAVTIELTQQQLDLAVRSNALWLQGGTPSDPILDVPHPSEYGFGALRCAIDDLNGDNVEWIGYPQGASHVFCYAYYVKPPPTSGTIVVRKQVDAAAGTPSEDFAFAGNVSYAPDGAFSIPAAPGMPGETTFYRAAGDEPWTFREAVPPGWTLTDLTCTSQTGSSVATTDRAAAAVSVRLAAGDVVTCTYTDRLTPPPAGLLLRKITLGSIGTFGFDVTGQGDTARATATTLTPDVAVAAGPPLTLAPGEHAIQERLPTDAGGTWRLTDVACLGGEATGRQPVRLTLASGAGAICTFTNTFRPRGAITLSKETRGAVGTAGFVISPAVHHPPLELGQSATTTRENTPVRATGDDTSALPLGRYVIQETTPPRPSDGDWALEAVVCDGVAVPNAQGRITVTLTPADPRVDCRFVNLFTADDNPPGPDPGPDPSPGPGPTPTPGPDPSPTTDLVITKRVLTPTVTVGDDARYLITITNRGPAAATGVKAVEQIQRQANFVSATSSQGRCRLGRLPICDVGTILPGQTVTIHVTVRTQHAGTFVNRVVTGTATAETTLRTNVARARVVVRGARTPSFTG